MKLLPLLASLAISVYAGPASESFDIRSDLEALDAALKIAPGYCDAKESRIDALKAMLDSDSLTQKQAFDIYGLIYDETAAYQFDMAADALDHQERLASEIGDRTLTDDILIEKSMLLCTSGMYLESLQLSEAIDTTRLSPAQMIRYYDYKQRFNSDLREYSQAVEDGDAMAARAGYYRGKIIENTGKSDPLHLRMEVQELLNLGLLEAADSVSQVALALLEPSSHDYAKASYYQAVVCRDSGREKEMLHWFIESAIADTKCAVKDNASLFSTAHELLSQEIDAERAFKYTQYSLNDALFFNSKLRPWQIAQSLPSIETAYNESVAAHQKRVRNSLIAISLLAVCLLLICFLVIALYRKLLLSHRQITEMNDRVSEYSDSLAEANEKLQTAISDLSEANAAKEEYIGLFLSMCSDYIDKLKKHQSQAQTDAELQAFYKAFDNAFLHLYPDFVREFNALLRPEARLTLRKDELLNTELRIFALIRLGITQSSHIASLLRYSVNTIYNYRAQVKNAALEDRDNFEERVKTIGNSH